MQASWQVPREHNRNGLLAVAALLLIALALAGGYAIRLVTTQTAVTLPAHAAVAPNASSSSFSAASDSCIVVGNHRGC